MCRIASLAERRFDVVVIGAGATGCGVARDAALRGLSVLLLDRGDIAAGTSSGSSRMIHGGLRYLMRAQATLVEECLHERSVLRQLAPHLVRSADFVLASYKPAVRERFPVKIGLEIARMLSSEPERETADFLNHEQVRARVPGLNPEGLRGGIVFHDCVTHDARLCLELALGAQAAGAVVETYVEVLGVALQEGQARGVRIRDRLSGEENVIPCRAVVEATGPWTGRLDVGRRGDAPLVAPSRGTHLACRPFVPPDTVLSALHPEDGRYVWAVGMDRYTWLGTTDVPQPEDPDNCLPTPAEIGYLERWLKAIVPRASARPLAMRAALRPLAASIGRSRDFRADFTPTGVLVVAGGKITNHRAMAERAVDRLLASAALFDVPHRGCVSATTPLPGAPPMEVEAWLERGPGAELGDPELRRHLLLRYGRRIDELLARIPAAPLEAARPLHPERPEIEAEVDHAVETEMARTLADVMFRRTDLWLTSDQGAAAVPRVARRMGALLGWSAAETTRQRDAYAAQAERARVPDAEEDAGGPARVAQVL